jgi:hypothetical protein
MVRGGSRSVGRHHKSRGKFDGSDRSYILQSVRGLDDWINSWEAKTMFLQHFLFVQKLEFSQSISLLQRPLL